MSLSTGTTVETYETPPTSPYSVVTTCSPTTQLMSISNYTSTATPESAQDTLSSPNQNDEPLLDCWTVPAKEAEEGLKMTESPGQVSYLSDVCMNGDTEVDAKLLQECLNTLQLNNIEESTHILNGELDSHAMSIHSLIEACTYLHELHIILNMLNKCSTHNNILSVLLYIHSWVSASVAGLF